MASDAGVGRGRWSAERRFHVAFSVAVLAAVVLGFARTFFLRPWFAEWARANSPPEPFFFLHGAVFAAWFVLLVAQPLLVSAGRVDLHRRLGWLGAGVAAAVVVTGTLGSLIAAGRPGGFTNAPLPPLRFLIVPLADMALFAGFVVAAFVLRRHVQAHKRLMLFASLSLVDAAVARWPFAFVAAASPVPGYAPTDVVVDLFLLPMLAWDLASRGRPHPATLWGALILIVAQPARLLLMGTDAWVAFAGWAVGLLGR